MEVICDWCGTGISPGEGIVLPVHPILQEMFGGMTVTVHREDCRDLIEEEMYAQWEKLEFGDETEEEAEE
jgi:hypothetical protein